jgi:hypothetical protein
VYPGCLSTIIRNFYDRDNRLFLRRGKFVLSSHRKARKRVPPSSRPFFGHEDGKAQTFIPELSSRAKNQRKESETQPAVILTTTGRACPGVRIGRHENGCPILAPVFLGARVGKHQPSPQNCHPERKTKGKESGTQPAVILTTTGRACPERSRRKESQRSTLSQHRLDLPQSKA